MSHSHTFGCICSGCTTKRKNIAYYRDYHASSASQPHYQQTAHLHQPKFLTGSGGGHKMDFLFAVGDVVIVLNQVKPGRVLLITPFGLFCKVAFDASEVKYLPTHELRKMAAPDLRS